MGGKTRLRQDSPGAGQPAIRLRRARADDRCFVRSLYLVNARVHLSALGPVDEDALRARFERTYRQYQASIICLAAQRIGWLQVKESKDQIHIGQLHLIPSHRNCGIGGRLIRAILVRAQESGRPVELNVIRGNPAIHLYQRLGFRLIGEDAEKLQMRWDARGKDGENPPGA
ncbi:Acetyltransferase (GNAT) family protein [Rhizobiales bacterium GAS188]|nr:Acetyltransferase (GNAT) family protein [Rhizobiales bacterium GAS188]